MFSEHKLVWSGWYSWKRIWK